MKKLPYYRDDFESYVVLDKGFSIDKKYLVTLKSKEKVLLRVRGIQYYDKQKKAFEFLQSLENTDVLAPKALELGTCEDDKSVYFIYSWLDGEDATDVIPKLSKQQQYQLGVKAGRNLRKIHELSLTSDPNSELREQYKEKLLMKVERYIDCGIRVDNDEKVFEYIKSNLDLLKYGNFCVLHGDYHINNMVINEDLELGIIDFERSEYGNQLEEFDRIIWCVQASIYFATGRIDGYFENNIPEYFFPLLALYFCMAIVSSTPWAKKYGEEQVQIMVENNIKILGFYNNMELTIPIWYTKAKEELQIQ